MRLWMLLAALSGFMAVAFDALASHGMGGIADTQAMEWLRSGARYQMYHALAALAAGALTVPFPDGRRLLGIAAMFFLFGTLLFSGTLYAMALVHWSVLSRLTPIGGLCFMAGWLSLAWACAASGRGAARS